MRIMKKIAITVVISAALILATISTVLAADIVLTGISIKPAGQPYSNLDRTWFVYELEPGGKIEDALYVFNNTDVEKYINVYPADSTPSSGGGFALRQKDEKMTDVGSWITLEQNEITLKPGESGMIKFTLQVPNEKTLDVGEHSGAILVQDKPKAVDPNQSGIILTTRVGARVYVTLPGEIKREIQYTSFNVKPTLYKDYKIPYIGKPIARLLKVPKAYSLDVGYINKGNVSNDVSIVITAKDELFNKGEEELKGIQKVGRETEAAINLEWEAPIFGKYSFKGKGTYKTADGEGTFETSVITLWIIPWDLVVAEGLLLLALIIIITTRKLRNSTKKWKKYKVTKKDTLQSLSIKHKVRWEKLAEVNKIAPPYALKPGTVILVPKSASKKK